jgi:hypothetical protein
MNRGEVSSDTIRIAREDDGGFDDDLVNARLQRGNPQRGEGFVDE